MPNTCLVTSDPARDELEATLARLDESERRGQSIEHLARAWRFAGIVDPIEVRAWVAVGVCDGHHAGLLKMMGIDPRQMASIPDARRLGLAFTLGEVSISEVKNLISILGSADASADAQTTHVRAKIANDSEPNGDGGTGARGDG